MKYGDAVVLTCPCCHGERRMFVRYSDDTYAVVAPFGAMWLTVDARRDCMITARSYQRVDAGPTWGVPAPGGKR